MLGGSRQIPTHTPGGELTRAMHASLPSRKAGREPQAKEEALCLEEVRGVGTGVRGELARLRWGGGEGGEGREKEKKSWAFDEWHLQSDPMMQQAHSDRVRSDKQGTVYEELSHPPARTQRELWVRWKEKTEVPTAQGGPVPSPTAQPSRDPRPQARALAAGSSGPADPCQPRGLPAGRSGDRGPRGRDGQDLGRGAGCVGKTSRNGGL